MQENRSTKITPQNQTKCHRLKWQCQNIDNVVNITCILRINKMFCNFFLSLCFFFLVFLLSSLFFSLSSYSPLATLSSLVVWDLFSLIFLLVHVCISKWVALTLCHTWITWRKEVVLLKRAQKDFAREVFEEGYVKLNKDHCYMLFSLV